MKQTVRDFFKQFPDDDACLAHLFTVRYGDDHACPKCETKGKYHRLKKVKAFSCQNCGHHLHPMAGTIYEGSTTPLQLWFYAFLFTKSRNGVSGKELQRQLGVTYKTAWRMGHKIREHMARVDGDDPLGGSGKTVQVDETFVGGYKKGGQGGKGKTIVMGMLEEGGDVMTEVIETRQIRDIIPPIIENVLPETEIQTDEMYSYKTVSKMGMGYTHKSVDHSIKQYVGKDGETTNSIEGFFMHLKRTIKGTHIWVSEKHMHSYLDEAEFIYNRRQNPERILTDLLYGYPKG